MNATELSGPQIRAVRVLVAARANPESRPVRASNRTTLTADLHHREMLTVHHTVADQLTAAGYVRVTNDVLRTLELTDTGRQLAREAGLG